MKKINEITSYLFENNLLISLSKDWINIFEGMPKFSAEYKNGRLVLTSQTIQGKERND